MQKNGGLRPRILEATCKLLVAEGLAGVTMRKIASAIGVKAPSLYHHFENKDRLIHAIIDEGHDRALTVLQDWDREIGDAGPLDRLEANLRAWAHFAEVNPGFYEVMYLVHVVDLERYPKESYRRTRRISDLGADLMKQAAAQGLIPDGDPVEQVLIAWIALHGYLALVLYRRLDVRLDARTLLDAIIDRIFLGLGVGGRRGARIPLNPVPANQVALP